MKPILVIGARATFARVIAEVCAQRDLRYELGGGDASDPSAVGRLFDRHAPWLVIEAGHQVDLDAAEATSDAEPPAQVAAEELLARECARRCAHLLSLRPAAHRDDERARTQLTVEQRLSALCPASLLARVGALFAPGRPPAFAPDLVHAVLDLAIDGAVGVWHLAAEGEPLSLLRAAPPSPRHQDPA